MAQIPWWMQIFFSTRYDMVPAWNIVVLVLLPNHLTTILFLYYRIEDNHVPVVILGKMDIPLYNEGKVINGISIT